MDEALIRESSGSGEKAGLHSLGWRKFMTTL
jgi:hypothetical protein